MRESEGSLVVSRRKFIFDKKVATSQEKEEECDDA